MGEQCRPACHLSSVLRNGRLWHTRDPLRLSRSSLMLGLLVAASAILITACSTVPPSNECVVAATEADAPAGVVDWMREPSDSFGEVERLAIETTIEEFRLESECIAYTRWLAGGDIPKVESDDSEGDGPIGIVTNLVGGDGDRRFDGKQSSFRFNPQDPDRPEVVAVNYAGSIEDGNGVFVLTFDEPVHTRNPNNIHLAITSSDGETSLLFPMSEISEDSPSLTMEFGPVEDHLLRAQSVGGTSSIRNAEGNHFVEGPIPIFNHPNAIFVDTDYSSDVNDPSLSRCAALLEFNNIAPIIVRSVLEADSQNMDDGKRSDWVHALRSELYDAQFMADRFVFDRRTLTEHPCTPLWSADAGSGNATKRNMQWACESDDPDVTGLLAMPYTDLEPQDRLLLRTVIEQSGIQECREYYPQLFFGRWIPLEKP